MKRIIIFGTGKEFIKNKEMLFSENIIALADNDIKKQGEYISGVKVIAPNEIIEYKYDYIIIASSLYIRDILEQLIALGVEGEKCYSYLEFNNIGKYTPTLQWRRSSDSNNNSRGNIIVFTHALDLTGAPIVLSYMVKIIKEKGYTPIVFSCQEGELEDEYIKLGVDIIVEKLYDCTDKEVYGLIKNAKYIILNTNQIMHIVRRYYEINNNIILWLHEPDSAYNIILRKEIVEYIDKIKIYAVSKVSQNAFYKQIKDKDIQLLPYGIPDQYVSVNKTDESNKIIFGIIGSITYRKGHDILFKAISQLTIEEQQRIKLIVVGKVDITEEKMLEEYYELEKNNIIEYTGVVERNNIYQIYNKIDAVICPSREEPFSGAVIEGMMNAKMSIVSDTGGICEYIENGTNGLIFTNESILELQELIRWCTQNREAVKTLGINARRTYEKYFTIERFADRIEQIMNI